MERLEIELYWREGLKIESKIRNFDSVLMDDRKKGQDSAPSPTEMFLSSVGSCLAMAFIYCTNLSGIELKPENFTVKVVGELRRVDERIRLTQVKAAFILKANGRELTKIQKCFMKFQPFCILSESIQMGIPFACDLQIEK